MPVKHDHGARPRPIACSGTRMRLAADSASGVDADRKWGEWAESLGSEYSRMRYESGEPCLHGPTRNTLVTLTCALETALRSVREPGRCQYIMDLHTPAACRPARKQQGVHNASVGKQLEMHGTAATVGAECPCAASRRGNATRAARKIRKINTLHRAQPFLKRVLVFETAQSQAISCRA
ncbi:unnamed protein product [Lota lota]